MVDPRLAGDSVDRCLNTWLLGTYSAQFNSLAVAADSTVAEMTCNFPLGELGIGSFLAIDDELCLVQSRDITNSRLGVVRGVRGTAPSPHVIGSAMEINPRFPRWSIRGELRQEIDSWPDALYVPKTFDVIVASQAGTIAVAPTIDGFTTKTVKRVRRKSISFMDDRWRRTHGYEIQGDFDGEGGLISLNESICIATTFRVTVACELRPELVEDFGDDCDLIGDVGMSPGMIEIAELGACYRLLMGRGSARLFPEAAGQTREPQEVGPRDIPAFAEGLLALRDRAEAGELERLAHKYGLGGQ